MAPARGGVPGNSHDLSPADRRYLLERVDEAAIVQLYADGFGELSLPEKTLAYHLYLAALAGRDIYYDQRYGHSLEMRAALEAVLRHPADVDPETLAQVHQYTKLFWLNSGPHNNLTARKFVPQCQPAAFAAAVRAAASHGATLPLRPGERLDQCLARLEPIFFDPGLDPIVTSKSPGPGEDILTASANNLYEQVTLADLEGFTERYGLNSRLVKQHGHLVEEVYRVGGRYDAEIRAIVGHLEEAIPFAPETTRHALRALVTFYRTGERTDREAYDTAWVSDKDSSVDTINGFVEVYLDPRGTKGAWESAVFYVNRERTAAISALAHSAQWFEDHLPFDPAYRKDAVTSITANAIDVVVEAGDSGPVTPVGINLPNDDRIRTEHGSKSVCMSNVMLAYERSTPDAYWAEFSWTDEEARRAEQWGSFASELATNLHEVIGHASGRADPRLTATPPAALRDTYSTIEESRADLVALYFVPDPRLVELGIVTAADQPSVVRAEYETYARNALVQLRRVREGTQIEEDHMRNRQLIVRWLMANTTAIQTRTRDGKTYYVVADVDTFRAGVATLLTEVQRIKSQGDYRAARALVDTYAVHFDGALRDEVVARVARVGLPSYTGFVMPRLDAVRNDEGAIVDVAISYPQDFTAQMLDYSKPC
jgi:dipeptidyl-peptidase III